MISQRCDVRQKLKSTKSDKEKVDLFNITYNKPPPRKKIEIKKLLSFQISLKTTKFVKVIITSI